MNCTGITNLFVKKRGKMTIYEGSISHKNAEGGYTRCSIECKFGDAKKFSPEVLAKLKENVCYTIEITQGFLSCDAWQDKTTQKTRRKLVLVIVDCKINKSTKVDESKLKKEAKANLNEDTEESDLPF